MWTEHCVWGFWFVFFVCLRTPVKIRQVLKMDVFDALSVFSPFPGLATVAAAAAVGLRMRLFMRLKPREEQGWFYLLLAWKRWVPWHRFWWQVIVAVGSVEKGLSALAVPRERGVKHQPGGRAGLRVQRAPTWGRAIFHIEAIKERRDSLVIWELQKTVFIHREFPGSGPHGPDSSGKASQMVAILPILSGGSWILQTSLITQVYCQSLVTQNLDQRAKLMTYQQHDQLWQIQNEKQVRGKKKACC